MIKFAKEKGKEYYYEMEQDINRAAPPISAEDMFEFTDLDGMVSHYMAACGMPLTIVNYDQDQRNIGIGEYLIGQTRLRVIDTPDGLRIIYSVKWMMEIESYLSSVENLENEANTPAAADECRIRVKCEGNTYHLGLDDEPLVKVGRAAGAFVSELVEAGIGVPVSSKDIAREHDLSPDSIKPRVIRKQLGEIGDLIESKTGSGSWLNEEAWA